MDNVPDFQWELKTGIVDTMSEKHLAKECSKALSILQSPYQQHHTSLVDPLAYTSLVRLFQLGCLTQADLLPVHTFRLY